MASAAPPRIARCLFPGCASEIAAPELDEHLRRHLHFRQFRCQCGDKFYAYSSLQTHILQNFDGAVHCKNAETAEDTYMAALLNRFWRDCIEAARGTPLMDLAARITGSSVASIASPPTHQHPQKRAFAENEVTSQEEGMSKRRRAESLNGSGSLLSSAAHRPIQSNSSSSEKSNKSLPSRSPVAHRQTPNSACGLDSSASEGDDDNDDVELLPQHRTFPSKSKSVSSTTTYNRARSPKSSTSSSGDAADLATVRGVADKHQPWHKSHSSPTTAHAPTTNAPKPPTPATSSNALTPPQQPSVRPPKTLLTWKPSCPPPAELSNLPYATCELCKSKPQIMGDFLTRRAHAADVHVRQPFRYSQDYRKELAYTTRQAFPDLPFEDDVCVKCFEKGGKITSYCGRVNHVRTTHLPKDVYLSCPLPMNDRCRKHHFAKLEDLSRHCQQVHSWSEGYQKLRTLDPKAYTAFNQQKREFNNKCSELMYYYFPVPPSDAPQNRRCGSEPGTPTHSSTPAKGRAPRATPAPAAVSNNTPPIPHQTQKAKTLDSAASNTPQSTPKTPATTPKQLFVVPMYTVKRECESPLPMAQHQPAAYSNVHNMTTPHMDSLGNQQDNLERRYPWMRKGFNETSRGGAFGRGRGGGRGGGGPNHTSGPAYGEQQGSVYTGRGRRYWNR